MINRICVYLHSCFRTGSSFSKKNAEIAQLVEHQLPKLRVASSNLVFRSKCKFLINNILQGIKDQRNCKSAAQNAQKKAMCCTFLYQIAPLRLQITLQAMATTKLYLDTRANASGTPVPIKISLCHQGRTVFHSTGIKVLPRQWDEKTCKVVRHPASNGQSSETNRSC